MKTGILIRALCGGAVLGVMGVSAGNAHALPILGGLGSGNQTNTVVDINATINALLGNNNQNNSKNTTVDANITATIQNTLNNILPGDDCEDENGGAVNTNIGLDIDLNLQLNLPKPEDCDTPTPPSEPCEDDQGHNNPLGDILGIINPHGLGDLLDCVLPDEPTCPPIDLKDLVCDTVDHLHGLDCLVDHTLEQITCDPGLLDCLTHDLLDECNNPLSLLDDKLDPLLCLVDHKVDHIIDLVDCLLPLECLPLPDCDYHNPDDCGGNPPPVGGNGAVPEPVTATLTVAGIGSLLLASRRRRS